MYGQFYVDHREPWVIADAPAVTLNTFAGGGLRSLIPVTYMPNLGNNYFGYVGKAIRLRAVGRGTTGATPGSLTAQILAGDGTDNNGLALGGGTVTWTASRTNDTWMWESYVRCRALGTSGSLFAQSWLFYNGTGIFQMNVSSPAATTVDLTAASLYITLQVYRSGSTVETMQLIDFMMEALN